MLDKGRQADALERAREKEREAFELRAQANALERSAANLRKRWSLPKAEDDRG